MSDPMSKYLASKHGYVFNGPTPFPSTGFVGGDIKSHLGSVALPPHGPEYWANLNRVVEGQAKDQASQRDEVALLTRVNKNLSDLYRRVEQENIDLRVQITRLENPPIHADGFDYAPIPKGIREMLAAEATDPDALEKQVENVLRGIQANKVIPRQVDDLHEATSRSKQGRAVNKAIKSSF